MKNTKLNFEIVNIFPKNIYATRLEIEENLKNYLSSIEMKERYPFNSSSVNTYLLDENNSEIVKIREKINHHLQNYIKEIFGDEILQRITPFITQSWLNVINPNGHMHPHDHYNSFLSGILYIETVDNDRIEILESDQDNLRFTDSLSVLYPVTTGNLLIFKSSLLHAVPPNMSQTKNRISLSFNTFVEGFVGDDTYLTKTLLAKHKKYK